MSQEPQIDKEFQALLPLPSPQEYEGLEQDIVQAGKLDEAIKVWTEENIIVDGYTRFDICSKHGIEKRYEYRSFANREEVKQWMRRNQLNRRNLSGQALHSERLKLLASIEDAERTAQSYAAEMQVTPRTAQRIVEHKRIIDELPEDLARRFYDSSIVYTNKDLKRLAELDAPNKQKVIDKLRSDSSRSLGECLPVYKNSKQTKHTIDYEKNFSGPVRMKIAHGKVESPTEAEVSKLENLTETKRIAVDDVLATGGATNVTDAVKVVEAAGKKQPKSNVPKDVQALGDKVEATFQKLTNQIDEVAREMGAKNKASHAELIASIKLAYSQWKSWVGR